MPTVLSRGVINLRVEPSVSELDFANAITIQGTTVPALTRRDARTTVELRDGQSFAIAGLLQTRNQQDVSQVPWIGSVPVLGIAVPSSAYQKQETDLVIIVTPRLVAPAAPGQQLASPLDSRLPANDVDFFLNGQMEVRKRYDDYVNSGGGLKGPYGHIIAPDVTPSCSATGLRKSAGRENPELEEARDDHDGIWLCSRPCCSGDVTGLPVMTRWTRYVQRSDTITMSAGDAKQVNAVTHTINPWPSYVGDRRIADRRAAHRRCRHALQHDDAAGGSGARRR